MTTDDYRELRYTHAIEHRRGHGNALYQLCGTCGRCEYAGGFCSWCRTGGYALTVHIHGNAGACQFAQGNDEVGGEILGVWRHG